MKMNVETRNGTDILRISGRMVFDPDLYMMRDIVHRELAKGIRRFVVDLSGVPSVDSSGLGELISIYTSITRLQGSIVLADPVPRVRGLLERIRLNEIFTIVDKADL